MTTRENPNHRKFNYGLQRIIAESVAETLNETDLQAAVTLRDAVEKAKARSTSRGKATAQALGADRPAKAGNRTTASR